MASADRFIQTKIEGNSMYYLSLLYTCTSLTQAKIDAIMSSNDGEGPTSCNQETEWADGKESYEITEIKKRLVKATSSTTGKSSVVIFGGWVAGSDEITDTLSNSENFDTGGPTNELWVFDHAAQIPETVLNEYSDAVHDSPYNVCPCCGTVQTCCGSNNSCFETCAWRRAQQRAAGQCTTESGSTAERPNECCGSIPIINNWRRIPLRARQGLLVPAPRYDHTASVVGVPALLSSYTKSKGNYMEYRMVVFGGRGNGRILDDLWELSLEASPKQDVTSVVEIQCDATDGVFRVGVGFENSQSSSMQAEIPASATVIQMRKLLGAIPGLLVSQVIMTRSQNAAQHLSQNMNSPPSTAANATKGNSKTMALNQTNSSGGTVSSQDANSVSGAQPTIAVTVCEKGGVTTRISLTSGEGSAISANAGVGLEVRIYEAGQTLTLPSSDASLAAVGARDTGFVALRTLRRWQHEKSEFVWERVGSNSPAATRPSRRADHSATVFKKTGGAERIAIYGGWDGQKVLDDVWVYAPHVQFGGFGMWTRLTTETSGKYLSVWPNFLMALVDVTGYAEHAKMKGPSMPKRYQHQAVALSTGFTTGGDGGSDGTASVQQPRETLLIQGGIGDYKMAEGNNWNAQGFPFGGISPDMFALCLDSVNDRYCAAARSLGQ